MKYGVKFYTNIDNPPVFIKFFKDENFRDGFIAGIKQNKEEWLDLGDIVIHLDSICAVTKYVMPEQSSGAQNAIRD